MQGLALDGDERHESMMESCKDMADYARENRKLLHAHCREAEALFLRTDELEELQRRSDARVAEAIAKHEETCALKAAASPEAKEVWLWHGVGSKTLTLLYAALTAAFVGGGAALLNFILNHI